MRTSWRAAVAKRSVEPVRRIGSLGLVFALAATGCQLSEPYLIPRRSLELVTSLQPDMRSRAQVPAVREGDRAPVLIDYRALQMNDAELARTSARHARFYRVQAAARNPLLLVGGVILGMALPHFALGLAVGLDRPSAPGIGDQRVITDVAGGALAMTLAGLHIAAGVVLIGVAERSPRIESSTPQMLNQYLNESPSESRQPETEKGAESESGAAPSEQ